MLSIRTLERCRQKKEISYPVKYMMYLASAKEAMASKAVPNESNMTISNQLYQDVQDSCNQGLQGWPGLDCLMVYE